MPKLNLASLDPPTAIGAPVMALGIFGAAALQQFDAGRAATAIVAAVAAIIWALLALALVISIRQRGISTHTAPAVASFGIGTWVAATAVVARMMMLAAPTLTGLIVALFLADVVLWLWFLPIALRNFAWLAANASAKPSGAILLATVATQAVALLALRLFPALDLVHWVATVLIGLGIACYGIGLALILRRYVGGAPWRLVDDWDNSNCILHGALSISGLAAVISGNFSLLALLTFWLVVVVAFVVVETIELLRLFLRANALGWHDGLFVYDVSQWARNFTFGMFYAFTLAFAERAPDLGICPLAAHLRRGVLVTGPYLVLLLLLAETMVMLWSAHRPKR